MSHVWVFGSGDCGQLALDEDTWSASRPTPHPFFADKPLKQIAAGALHTLALGVDGSVYSWGCNDEKALGHEEPEFQVGLVHHNLPRDIVQVAAGDSISAALTSDGRVFTWGTFRDSKGLLGHSSPSPLHSSPGPRKASSGDSEGDVQQFPTLLLGLPPIKSIAAGSNHLFAVAANGELFSWGCGEQGQLGRRVLERHKQLGLRPVNVTPRHGRSIVPVLGVCAGAYHTLLLVNEGRMLLATGHNNYGQLGTGDTEPCLNARPVEISGLLGEERIVAMAAGEHHSVLLTSHGRVFAAGRNDAGELGIPDLPSHSDVFALVNVSEPVRAIAAGGHHTLAIGASGQVHAWGYGEMHQLGLGRDDVVRIPTPLAHFGNGAPSPIHWTPAQVACGAQHSVIMMQSQQ